MINADLITVRQWVSEIGYVILSLSNGLDEFRVFEETPPLAELSAGFVILGMFLKGFYLKR